MPIIFHYMEVKIVEILKYDFELYEILVRGVDEFMENVHQTLSIML